HLAPHVDEGVVGPDRVRGDDDALDQRVRVGHHERDVLAGARLRLVGVDNQIMWLGSAVCFWALRDEPPLHAGGEARAAAAAQAGVLDGLDDRVGVHAQRLLGRLVRAVAFDREGVGPVPARGQDRSKSRHASGAFHPLALATLSPSSEGPPAEGPSPAWSSGSPARMREASLNVHSRFGPRVGRTSLPSRRSSTSCLAESGVWLSKNSQLTIMTGAKSQAALHSRRSSETLPSGLVSSWPSPVCSDSSSQIWSPPMPAQGALMQTPTWYSPAGLRLYIV